MSTIVKIKNKNLCALISTLGAELKSINDGKEYIWQSNPKIWARSGPVLFPVCGKLKDDTYTYCGQKYKLGQHGFSKDTNFEIKNQSDDTLHLQLKSNINTKNVYPFDFEFNVIFKISDKKLSITYSVVNKDIKDIYFSFGGHEGYSCPKGVENYTLKFNKDNILERYMIKDGILTGKTEILNLKDSVLSLNYCEFEKGTYMFKHLNSDNVIFSAKDGSRNIKVTFEGFNQLALWTLQNREYLCIEPWCGFSQTKDFDGDITKKYGIIKLSRNSTFERTHSIEIL